MALYVQTAYDATCDTCDAAFSPGNGLLPTIGEFTDYGWVIDDDNALCPTCANREGTTATTGPRT
ncbi:hypothetical protein ABN028_24730 [Actinopolymorpha sp. B17G11]|uniref:hypothetical protein n=1 Tax=Actinopolymorpha sp. B17G11 TaxID=3160861 RepID=UPI0032E37019